MSAPYRGPVPVATTPARTAWQALGQRRFLLGRWPWRALGHTMSTLVVWVVFAIPCLAVGAPIGGAIAELGRGQVLPAVGLMLLGLALGFVLLPLLATPLLALDRWRARLVDPTPLAAPPRAPSEFGAWLHDRYLTAHRWRYAGYVAAVILLQGALLAALSLLGTRRAR